MSIGWYNDDLLRFDVDNSFSRYDVALRIFDADFNAGRGDLEYAPEPAVPAGDVNGDGAVDVLDLLYFVDAFVRVSGRRCL